MTRTSPSLVLRACLLLTAAGAAVALASPAPTPAAKGNVNGIDVAISSAGMNPNGGTKDVAVFNSLAGGSTWFDGTAMFGVAIVTTSCNPQANNGAPSPRYPLGTPGIVAASPYDMGDWIAGWESGVDRNNVNIGLSAGDRHPYIATNAYRINASGRLEMLASSWAKHSFSAASSSQGTTSGSNGQSACGSGSCVNTIAGDNELEANCCDTYTSGHNSTASLLGPRSEINPRGLRDTPGWHYQNSFFDNYTTSGTGTATLVTLAPTASRNDGSKSFSPGGLSAFQLAVMRRDEVNAAALGAGGRVILEGMYVVNGDNYKLNNVAHRQYTSTVATGTTPASSQLAFAGQHTWGPALLQWGDQKSQADPSTDGTVFVASRVVNNGNGTWRYEYNVYNLDLDRQIDSFEVPVPAALSITSFGFFQPRQLRMGYDNGAWSQSYDSTKKSIVWSAPAAPVLSDPQLAALNPPLPAGTVMSKNTIHWGTMYTFWYDANNGPRTGDTLASLNPVKPGSFSTMMTAEVRAPRHPSDLGIQGGAPGDDGLLDNNDFVAFINLFFNNDLRADLGIQGGAFGHDGLLDNNDFVVFINMFFQG
jgi:hypothetical protein